MPLLHERTDLGNGRRSPGGLLENAYTLPDGWENGIAFLGTGCSEPEIVAPCVVTDRTETRPGDANIFEPIWINQSAGCSTLSQIGTVDIARDRLESTTEWALGRALATGAGSNNPALADAENVHSAAYDPATVAFNVVHSVACIEQAAADVGFGAEVFLHAPVLAAAFLANTGMMTDDYRSPAGYRWIISPGYPVAPADGGTAISIWATGSVFAAVTPAQTLVDGGTGQAPTGWRYNTDAAYRQRLGLSAFDPCLNLSATFTVPACIGGS